MWCLGHNCGNVQQEHFKEISACGMYMQKQMGSDSDDQLFLCFLTPKDLKILMGSSGGRHETEIVAWKGLYINAWGCS